MERKRRGRRYKNPRDSSKRGNRHNKTSRMARELTELSHVVLLSKDLIDVHNYVGCNESGSIVRLVSLVSPQNVDQASLRRHWLRYYHTSKRGGGWQAKTLDSIFKISIAVEVVFNSSLLLHKS